MKKGLAYTLIILLLLYILWLAFSPFQASSKVCYINNQAQGRNSGDSWRNAWHSFAAISGLSSGDTVYISGGKTEKVYQETLNCTKGVTYLVGQEHPHNGRVIIDVIHNIANCIVLENELHFRTNRK